MAETAITPQAEIKIRHCHGLDECQACFDLQQRVWGVSNIDVPMPMFVVAQETGGQVLGAFLEDDSRPENMVGFTMAIAGWRDGRPFLHSHMTAVLSEMRDHGIGRKLKLFQREDALERGIDLVEWTFDPLETKNAYFNLMRLGAIARRYLPNVYGITTSPLHGGLPTDRFIAEWRLQSDDVLKIIGGDEKPWHSKESERGTVLIPDAIHALKTENPVAAIKMQSEIREQFQHWFAKGYEATRVEKAEGGARYILEPWK